MIIMTISFAIQDIEKMFGIIADSYAYFDATFNSQLLKR